MHSSRSPSHHFLSLHYKQATAPFFAKPDAIQAYLSHLCSLYAWWSHKPGRFQSTYSRKFTPTQRQDMDGPPPKRQAVAGADDRPRASPMSLIRDISPPMRRSAMSQPQQKKQPRKVIASPFRMTKIRDLPAASNVDAVSLHDLLGDPLIAECWEFNYLHDVEYLMSHFDQDVRSLVKIHIVHGFWKREDQNRIMLEVSISQFSYFLINVVRQRWNKVE